MYDTVVSVPVVCKRVDLLTTVTVEGTSVILPHIVTGSNCTCCIDVASR